MHVFPSNIGMSTAYKLHHIRHFLTKWWKTPTTTLTITDSMSIIVKLGVELIGPPHVVPHIEMLYKLSLPMIPR